MNHNFWEITTTNDIATLCVVFRFMCFFFLSDNNALLNSGLEQQALFVVKIHWCGFVVKIHSFFIVVKKITTKSQRNHKKITKKSQKNHKKITPKWHPLRCVWSDGICCLWQQIAIPRVLFLLPKQPKNIVTQKL